MRRLSATAIAVACLVALAACGSDSSSSSSSTSATTATESGPLVVSAAASLQDAFSQYGKQFGDGNTRFSFAGSDELAAQIQQGVKPDVFASANTTLPEELYKAGKVDKPTVFAGNRLVLAVPAGSSKVTSLSDTEKQGVKLAIGSETVPIGSYTRKVLGGLPASQSKAVLGNVRTEEPDVKGIVGKLSQGAVDAGFVYVTDVTATKGKLKAIALPASLQPTVAYGVAVVEGAKHPKAAQQFIDGLMQGSGQQALKAAGFLPPPQ
jgi:molybdate transport system substrate-binding protein